MPDTRLAVTGGVVRKPIVRHKKCPAHLKNAQHQHTDNAGRSQRRQISHKRQACQHAADSPQRPTQWDPRPAYR